MTLRVRPFAERDYAAFARIRSTGEADPTTPEEARDRDERWDRSRYDKVRVVAVDEEDAPLGYGEIYHEPSRFEPGRYFIRIGVDPARRRRGIGGALWVRLAAELHERGAGIACLWAGDHTACAEFIGARGFREVIRAYEQVLAVARAPLPTRASEERVIAAGARIVTLRELMAERADALVKAHALYTACRLDQPTLGRVSEWPFAEWHAFYLEDPAGIPDAYFLAIAGAELVGNCSVRREEREEDALRIGITGVLPAWRRRGIARALKLRTHGYAKANGYREIRTSNTRPNTAMLALNDALGYAIVGSHAGYELAIPSSP